MIDSVRFRNFKVLGDTSLPLERFTLLVGPNGSGKSTALNALLNVVRVGQNDFWNLVTASRQSVDAVEVVLQWGAPHSGVFTTTRWLSRGAYEQFHTTVHGQRIPKEVEQELHRRLAGIGIYSLDANSVASQVSLQPHMHLESNGAALAGVLDGLRDRAPERFEELNAELGRWLPEFDRILFDTPAPGNRAFLLRTRTGHHRIPARDLSQGTLFALAILTLAYLPDPPPMMCIEEPDRGMHPRLLRSVRDALYRLSYPEKFDENRPAVQVVATTHSPYFLDLYREYPEEVVIAHKIGPEARFERLSDRQDLQEILGDAHLGEVWYSGILGGVPGEE